MAIFDYFLQAEVKQALLRAADTFQDEDSDTTLEDWQDIHEQMIVRDLMHHTPQSLTILLNNTVAAVVIAMGRPDNDPATLYDLITRMQIISSLLLRYDAHRRDRVFALTTELT